jgi:ATP sulfurylase
MLQEEEIPPLEFTRPEIAKILIEGMKQKVTEYNI